MKQKVKKKSTKKTSTKKKVESKTIAEKINLEVPKPILFGATLMLITLIALMTAIFLPAKFAQQLIPVSDQTQGNIIQKQVLSEATAPAEESKVVFSEVKPTSSPVYAPVIAGYQVRVPILMYHYVGNNPNPDDKARYSLSIPPDLFESEMKYLAENGYSAISLDTLYAALHKQATLPGKPVILTFDDGYIDFYINAYPILRKYNMHATVFIPTGLMNQGYYLQWSQIKEMQASGLVSFGAHTVNHAYLPSLSVDKMRYELTESKRVLQEQLGIPVNFMAYPGGATNNQVIEMTKQAGYIGSVGTWAGTTQSESTIYNMPRLRLNGYIDLTRFAEYL